MLRSNKVPLAALYLRARLLKFIDEPWRSRAQRQLQGVLRFRKGDLPPQNVPLILQPAAHDLRTEVKSLIKNIIREQKCNFPPLLLPSDKLILRKGQQLTQLVFNYRAFMRTWTRNANVLCKCKRFQSTTQANSIVEGHVMCAARDIAPTSCLAKANLAETTFSSGRSLEVAGPHSIVKLVQTMEASLESHSRHVILGRQAMEVTCCSVTQRHTSSVEPQTGQRCYPLLCKDWCWDLRIISRIRFSLPVPVHYHKLLCRSFGRSSGVHAMQEWHRYHHSAFAERIRGQTSRTSSIQMGFSMEKRSADSQDPSQRIQTLRESQTHHSLYEMLAHQSQLFLSHGVVLDHAGPFPTKDQL